MNPTFNSLNYSFESRICNIIYCLTIIHTGKGLSKVCVKSTLTLGHQQHYWNEIQRWEKPIKSSPILTFSRRGQNRLCIKWYRYHPLSLDWNGNKLGPTKQKLTNPLLLFTSRCTNIIICNSNGRLDTSWELLAYC